MQVVHFEYALEVYILLGFDHIFAAVEVFESITLFEEGRSLLFGYDGLETVDAHVLLLRVIERVVGTCFEIYKLTIVEVVTVGKQSLDLGTLTANFGPMNRLLGKLCLLIICIY